ncbi:uncharacterized protein N7459_004510 [Penicillium hispanicum]|uniref:uncharacterized protein n=1 Tax=Penicillium hispanicum TaxID=1080232 RepID=UPI002541E8D2|nr:uncharacterized protein N7459_004510 [Penicillium hispanicum]KAJ5584710.1 hypothetical protein N7459_004510 [Penicillium hispanicum]
MTEELLYRLMRGFGKNTTCDKSIDLGTGTYRDENGRPWVLPIVRKALRVSLAKDLLRGNPGSNHGYLAIGGLHSFLTATQKGLKLFILEHLFSLHSVLERVSPMYISPNQHHQTFSQTRFDVEYHAAIPQITPD